MTRRGTLVCALTTGVLLLGACSDPKPSPEMLACQAWISAVNSSGGASVADLRDIADKSSGDVHRTMEAAADAFRAFLDKTGSEAQVHTTGVAVESQCAELGVAAQS